MITSDLLYVVIPLINSLGNVLLKLSIEEKRKNRQLRFIIIQLSGYSTFILVIIFSYIFLLTHNASLFVLIFSLNYLSTLYASRWILKDHYTTQSVMYDAVMVVGIVIFYFGQNH